MAEAGILVLILELFLWSILAKPRRQDFFHHHLCSVYFTAVLLNYMIVHRNHILRLSTIIFVAFDQRW